MNEIQTRKLLGSEGEPEAPQGEAKEVPQIGAKSIPRSTAAIFHQESEQFASDEHADSHANTRSTLTSDTSSQQTSDLTTQLSAADFSTSEPCSRKRGQVNVSSCDGLLGAAARTASLPIEYPPVEILEGPATGRPPAEGSGRSVNEEPRKTKMSENSGDQRCGSHSRPQSVSGEIAILIDKLLESPNDVELQTRVMRSFRRLSRTCSGRDLIGDSGGVSLITDCMYRFSRNDNLITLCCMVLANLSFNHHQNKVRSQKSKAIDFIIGLLNNRSLAPDQVAYICLALRNVSSGHKENQAYLGSNGAISGICSTLRLHPHFAELQVQAIAALGNIATASKTCQMQIREGGGLQFMIDAMRNHATDVTVVECSLLALRNASFSNERNQRTIGALGGVDQVVLAMKAFPENASVQVRSCGLLRCLTFDQKNRQALGENGGVAALMKSLDVMRHSNEQLAEGMKALSNSLLDIQENKYMAIRCDCIPKLVGFLKPDGDNEVLASAFRILRNLTDCSPETCNQIRENGVTHLALTCLREQESHEDVGEHVLALLLNLFSDHDQAKILSGEIDLEELDFFTSRTMEGFIHNLKIKEYGSSILAISRRLRSMAQDDDKISGKGRTVAKVAKMSKRFMKFSKQGSQDRTGC